ncbi:hypothetical protein NESM_000263900 [Novymonas esmeraldas]|uniref:Uncharacterized protein n=1 Tax=Novymonas esmeraldas TaxID=1808958 RepID=A0AAW0F6U4_9TRYP
MQASPDSGSVARVPPVRRRGDGGGSGVSTLAAAVGRLLSDYVEQLREDLLLSHGGGGGAVKTEGADGVVPAVQDDDLAARLAVDDAPDGDGNGDDGAVPLTEADAAECRHRLQRLQRVMHLLTLFTRRPGRRCGADGADAKPPTMADAATATARSEADNDAIPVSCEAVQRNPVLMAALHRFDGMARRFEGATAATDATRVADLIQPILHPVSLADGALSVLSRNMDIVFRRRPPTSGATAPDLKRPRDEAPQAAPPSSSVPPLTPLPPSASASGTVATTATAAAGAAHHWGRLAAQQRRDRFALYTARVALLPRIDVVCAPFYISPAVRQLAQLNSTAECAMLLRAWCVHTKAHLLREAPAVAGDVEAYRVALAAALQSFSAARQAAFLADMVYLEFVCADSGVVRVCVQHTLFLDLTYDVPRRHWRAIALHWNLLTTSAGASLLSTRSAQPLVAATASLSTDRAASAAPLAGAAAPSLARVMPMDPDALHGFVQRALEKDGLSGGLRAANRAVCATVMDALATQLQSLQRSFFSGGALGRLAEVEVRPGTFISCRLAISALFMTAAPVLHVKVAVLGGTVVVECVRGTEVSSRVVTLPLAASSLVPMSTAMASAVSPMAPVVDMEAVLWRCVGAGLSVTQ